MRDGMQQPRCAGADSPVLLSVPSLRQVQQVFEEARADIWFMLPIECRDRLPSGRHAMLALGRRILPVSLLRSRCAGRDETQPQLCLHINIAGQHALSQLHTLTVELRSYVFAFSLASACAEVLANVQT